MRSLPRLIRARPTLFGNAAFGVALILVLPASLPLVTRCLAAWCLATTVFVILVSWRMTGRSRAQLERGAADLDSSATAILALAVVAAAASIVAVIFELSGMQAVPSNVRGLHLALAMATVVCSWFFIQAMFAVHYTHYFYGDDPDSEPALGFAGNDEPDFWDFVYFTVSIGATSQTSDTAVRTREMRRVVTAHAIFAFFFNTTVLALAVNIGASLLGT